MIIFLHGKKYNMNVICNLNFKVNYLFLDSNSIIYDSCVDFKSEEELYNKKFAIISILLDVADGVIFNSRFVA